MVTIAPMDYALRLRQAAGEAGIYSARELARLLDVQEQTVKLWYSGKSRPNGKNLTNLLAILRVGEDWLMYGSGNKQMSSPVQGMDAEGDFRAALAVIHGMGTLLSERGTDISCSDANKIGRTITKAAQNADQAFQLLTERPAAKANG
jgi:transcriptional regulator with XRE-family HTH domain